MLASTFNMPLLGCSDYSGSEDMDKDEVMEATTSSHEKNTDLHEATLLYEKLMQNTMSADQVCHTDVMTRIDDTLKRVTHPSSLLAIWLQYMDIVDILRKYIRAEHTGNLELHLQAVSEMLPYLAAFGHNYMISAWVYLQRMAIYSPK